MRRTNSDRRHLRGAVVAGLLALVSMAGCATPTTSPSAAGTAVAAASLGVLPSPTPGAASSGLPTGEPATGQIVFARFVNEYTVWVTDPHGGVQTQLLPGDHECPRWSPDGTDVAMSPHGVFRNVGQANARYEPFEFEDRTLTLGCSIWSPDGRRLAFEGWDETDPTRNGIYTASAIDGSGLQRITSNPDGRSDIPGAYSPDGRQIFFARGPLMVVAMDGADPVALTEEGDYGPPSLSPDGRTLVATRDGRLYLVAVDGSSATPIPGPIWGGGPVWSPDGNWIAFSLTTNNVSQAIGRVRADGSGLFQITHGPGDEEFPDWAP